MATRKVQETKNKTTKRLDKSDLSKHDKWVEKHVAEMTERRRNKKRKTT